MLYFPTKVNHLGSMDVNLVFKIVHFPGIQVSQTYLTPEFPFLRQLLQEQCSFGIHLEKPKFKLTNLQALYIVLGLKGRKPVG